jgi:rRNA maturation endonuclease Nob1
MYPTIRLKVGFLPGIPNKSWLITLLIKEVFMPYVNCVQCGRLFEDVSDDGLESFCPACRACRELQNDVIAREEAELDDKWGIYEKI